MKRALLGMVLFSSMAMAGSAHVHGEQDMNLVLNGNTLAIGITGPVADYGGQLDGLESQELIRLPADAQCERIEISSNIQALEGKKGHSDVELQMTWQCQQPDALPGLRVQLFESYPEIHEVHVQAVINARSLVRTLTVQEPELTW